MIDFNLTPENYRNIAIQSGKAIAIIAGTFLLIKAISTAFKRQVRKKGVDEGLAYAISQMSKYILIVVAIVLCLESFGINVNVLLAGSAALLVGLGLGIQQIFNDVISGILLLIEGSVKVGDILESEKIVGEVIKIGLRTSEVLTRENVVMIVPNSKFVSEKVVNWTHNDQPTRFMITIGVAYGSDPKIVQDLLLQSVNEHDDVEASEGYHAFARFVDFGDSSLDFELYFFSLNMFRIDNVKSDIRCRMYDLLTSNGIGIPFPQRDLHIISGNAGNTDTAHNSSAV